MSRANQFYQIKGTLATDIPSYVVRAADEELYQQVQGGNYCYVLTTRQMGKSSLMMRTAERLRAEGAQVAIVDLTGIGGDEQSVTANEWYYGFAYTVNESLGLHEDLDAWWERRARLPALQRLVRFFREFVLAKTEGRFVIFVDEIDTTLNLSFAADFFAAIRACFNARAEDAEFRRLTFVLLGVATPNDLIADPKRTPFNIGTRVDLADFTRDQAFPLAEGLGSQSAGRQEALDRILFWTDGHPYLTQKVCLLAAELSRDGISPADVDRIVESEFFGAGADRRDDNLSFVRNRLAGRGALTQRLLRLYRRVLRGDRVKDVPTSVIQNELKLTGLVKARDDGTLTVRNAIYQKVFGESWIKEVWPAANNWKRATGAACLLLLLSAFLGYEAVYPWQLIDTLKRANGEEANLARVAYKRLGRVPFRGGQATRLWDDYNLRRARWAIDLDQQANRHQDAYRAAESAHVESSRSPDFRRESGAVFSEFFERRAIRAAFAEQRDESILWWLKALTVLPGRPELRRAVSQLVDPEYKRLVRTIRTGTLTRPNPYSTDPTFAQLSQDGRLVVTLAEDGIVRVWNLDGEVAIPVVLRRRVSRVSALAIRPDGKLLVVGQDNGAALLWRLDQPTAEPEELKSNKGQIARLVFGPDDKHLVITYFASGAALLWRADRPSEHPTELRGTYGSNTAVAFSRDGAQIMIVGNTSFDSGQALGTPRIWRIDKPGSDPVVFRPQKGGVDAVAFSPDGAQFVTLGSDRPTVRFWQLNQPAAEPVDKTEGVCGSVQPAGGSIALSPDASSFITTTISFLSPPGALLWRFDRPSGSPASLRGHEGFNVDDAFPPNGSRIVTADAAFSPDGSRIVTAGDDGGVQIWQSRDPDAVPVRVAGSAAPVDQVAFNRDGVRLASLERDGTARVWNVSRLIPPPQAFVDHGDAIRSVAISPDGSHLVTIGEHGVVCLWKIDEPDAKQVALGDRSRAWIAVAFSPDSARLAISDPERNVRIQRVDKPTDRAIASMATKSSVSAVAFSADGTRLAAACVDGNIYIWRLDGSAADPLILKGSGGVYEPPVFSPDGTRLVTVQRWVTRIWQIGRPGASPGEPTELAGDFDVVAFSSDSKTLLRVGRDGTVTMWRENQIVNSPDIPRTERSKLDLAFSPDGTSLFVASRWWARSFRVDGTTLAPVASRPFPNLLPRHCGRFFRFLDPSGDQIQVAVMPTRDKVILKILSFDTDYDPPIEGDAETLLAEWQKRLALKIQDDGDIVPAN